MIFTRFIVPAIACVGLAGCSDAAQESQESDSQLREDISGGVAESGFPAVGLVNTAASICTGTLISKSWVLTAKHCGAAQSFGTGPSGAALHAVDFTVMWVPSDGSNVNLHDLQLAHLQTPITNIRPLSIFTGPAPAIGRTCTAVGYGLDSNGASGAKRSATVVLDQLGPAGSPQTLVAAAIRVHAGSGLPQKGDSGGPLLCGDRIAGELTGFLSTDLTHPYYTALSSDDPTSSGFITQTVADDVSEPPISAITGGPNVMDLFIRGTDGQVWHKWSTGSSWGPSEFGWEALGGYITGTPEAATWGGSRIDVFARGGDSNPQTDSATSLSLWDLIWNGQTWTWTSLGGHFVGHPSAVAWPQSAAGPQGVAAFGVDDNGNGVFTWWNGSSWLHGILPTDDGVNPVKLSGPIKAVNVNNSTDVYAVGTDSQLYLSHVVFGDEDNPVSLTWLKLGGPVTGTPSIQFGGQHTIDVFAHATSGGVLHKWVVAPSANWLPSALGWEQMGGSLISAPVAAEYRKGEISILAADATSFQYKAWFGNGWVPSTTTWDKLGGLPVEPATMLPFPSVQTIDAFTVGNDFTPSLMQYATNGPSGSFGWYPIASLGGILSPW